MPSLEKDRRKLRVAYPDGSNSELDDSVYLLDDIRGDSKSTAVEAPAALCPQTIDRSLPAQEG